MKRSNTRLQLFGVALCVFSIWFIFIASSMPRKDIKELQELLGQAESISCYRVETDFGLSYTNLNNVVVLGKSECSLVAVRDLFSKDSVFMSRLGFKFFGYKPEYVLEVSYNESTVLIFLDIENCKIQINGGKLHDIPPRWVTLLKNFIKSINFSAASTYCGSLVCLGQCLNI
jgi:hypothetical protein